MSKITQRKKELKAKGSMGDARPNNYSSKGIVAAPSTQPPHFTRWTPGAEDPPNLRYWEAPRVGDIVQTRFPDYLKGQFSFETQTKVRPCMVVGVEEFADAQVIVRVAYGSSQVDDRGEPGRVLEGVGPGEVLISASDAKTGLKYDTKFSLRKVLELPFSTDHFSPFENSRFGVHPKRGRVDVSNPEYMRALDSAIDEARRLGSALEQTSAGARLHRDFRTGRPVR